MDAPPRCLLKLLCLCLLATPTAADEAEQVGDAPARQPIELPRWVAPSAAELKEQPSRLEGVFDLTRSSPVPAPPREPAPEEDLGVLLAEHHKKLTEPEPPVASPEEATPAESPEPAPLAHSEAKPLEPPVEGEQAEPPLDFEAEARRIERAASMARTPHALTRLIHRCEVALAHTAGPDAGAPHDAPHDGRVRRVAAWACQVRGRDRAASGDTRAAIDDFMRAVLLDPESVAARHDLAVTLAQTGRETEAIDELDRVISAKPDDVAARRNRAELWVRNNQPLRAIADCDAAIKLLRQEHPESPSLVEFYELRGRALQAAGRSGDAARDFGLALRLKPDDARLLTCRGNVSAASGYFDQAITDYAAALRADPSSADAYRCLAWVLATCPDKRLRDPKTAVEASWRASRLAGFDDPLVFDASAAAHASAGDFDEAIRWQQRALVAAGDTPPAGLKKRLTLYQRGQAYVAPKKDASKR